MMILVAKVVTISLVRKYSLSETAFFFLMAYLFGCAMQNDISRKNENP